ncbi:MAG: GNVR domain-containing protein [Candidatus Zixiibacteriota bacterium]
MKEEENNIFKILEILGKYFKFIVTFVLIITVLITAASFLLENNYMAKSVILPSGNKWIKMGWGGGFDKSFSVVSGVSVPMRSTPTDIYIQFLISKPMLDKVISDCNLDTYYKYTHPYDLYEIVKNGVRLFAMPTGTMEIAYVDTNPQKAADIVNSMVDNLIEMDRRYAAEQAGNVTQFLEKRLDEVKISLDTSLAKFQAFQTLHKTFDLDQQAEIAVEAAVKLKIAFDSSTIELNILKRTLPASDSRVASAQRRVEEIQKQIKLLENGGENGSYLNLPLAKMPTLKAEYTLLATKVKIDETLYGMISEQLEQSRIQESMDTPTITIIDRAIPPRLKTSPKRSMIAIVSFVVSLLFALFWSFMLNYLRTLKIKSPDNYQRLGFFITSVFGWLPGVKKVAPPSEN